MSLAETESLIQGVTRDLRDMQTGHAAERHDMERRHAHEAAPLKQRLSELQMQFEKEKSAAVSHPDEGRRVFRVEEVYAWSGALRPSGTKRITGVVEVWRRGSNAQPGFRADIGRAIVRLCKADGTPGVRCEYFEPCNPWSTQPPRWQFQDGKPSNVPEPEKKELEL